MAPSARTGHRSLILAAMISREGLVAVADPVHEPGLEPPRRIGPHRGDAGDDLAVDGSHLPRHRASVCGGPEASHLMAQLCDSLAPVEIGAFSFAETEPGQDPGRRLRDLVEEIVLADEVGLDVFGVGEHHRPDFVASAPAIVLAAAAGRTRHIRLTSAVTVLSSDDPVRVFQQFAALDQLSSGRAEIMAGRGSFIESFPLFGYALEDYDELFEEKLDLLLRIRESARVTLSGRHRPALDDAGVHPRPFRDPLPVWVAVGGTPRSVVRAGSLGLPLAVAILSGPFDRFVPLVERYREVAAAAGHDPAALPVGINAP